MKTVIFIDLDDTILNGPLDTAVFPYIANEFQKHKPDLDHSMFMKEIISILNERYIDWRVDAFDWDELVLMTALKYNIPVRVSIEELIREYAKPPYIRVHDHVIDTLQELRKDKERILAISTNGFWKYQAPIIAALGLGQYFDYILTPDIMSCLKGQKRFYQHTLNGSKLQITIGDRYDSDVEWPKDLGFKAIWKPVALPKEVDPSASPVERAKMFNIPQPFKQRPDAIILGFHEVPEIIRLIEEQYSH